MTSVQERAYARASGLATALGEQLLHEARPQFAGSAPMGGGSWHEHASHLAAVLDALAWAVAPDPDRIPDASLLESLPPRVVVALRDQADDEDVVGLLRAAAAALRADQAIPQSELMAQIAQQAEHQASEALRRMVRS